MLYKFTPQRRKRAAYLARIVDKVVPPKGDLCCKCWENSHGGLTLNQPLQALNKVGLGVNEKQRSAHTGLKTRSSTCDYYSGK